MSERRYVVTVAPVGRPTVVAGPFRDQSHALAYADTMRQAPGIDAGRTAVVPVQPHLDVARAVLNPPARGGIEVVRDTDGIAGVSRRISGAE